MKYISLFFILLLSLNSCQTQTKEENKDLVQLKTERQQLTKQLDSLGKRLKKIDKALRKLDKSKPLQKVSTLIAKDTIFNHYIALQGIVASDKNVILRPEMGGTIQRVFIKEGQRVSKGQTLVQLDASLLNNKADELKNQLNLAKTTFERQERLWNQKIGSEMQYLNAKTRKEGLEKSLKSLYAQIAKMKIKAPFSGSIDEIFSHTGELAGPQTPIIRLINLHQMYIEAEVPETYLNTTRKGTKVLVNFEAIGKQLEAKISEVSNYINPNNRSFKIKILIPNKGLSIKPNMLADLQINDFTAKGVVLPTYIIQMNQKGEKFVFAIIKDSTTKVSKRTISIVNEYNNNALIKDGVKADEILVNKGGKFVKDGDEVVVE